jgi:uncharacterized protein
MKHFKVFNAAPLILAFGITLNGCSVLSPQQDHTRYFVLTPKAAVSTSDPLASQSRSSAITIGLGPVSIPPYLERPEVVTRLSDTEFSVSDWDRWGEPLEVSVSRVLQQDLAAENPAFQIVPFPWPSKTPIDYRISVDFQRLERTANGQAEVQATWSIRTGAGKLVQNGHSMFADVAGSDQRSASAALSGGIARVSGDIAQALTKYSQPRATQ